MGIINLLLPPLNDGFGVFNNLFSTMLVSVLYMYCYEMISTGIKEKEGRKIFCGAGLALLLYLPVIIFGYVDVPMTHTVVISLTFIPNTGSAFILQKRRDANVMIRRMVLNTKNLNR